MGSVCCKSAADEHPSERPETAKSGVNLPEATPVTNAGSSHNASKSVSTKALPEAEAATGPLIGTEVPAEPTVPSPRAVSEHQVQISVPAPAPAVDANTP